MLNFFFESEENANYDKQKVGNNFAQLGIKK